MIEAVVMILLALNVFQFIFWSFQNQKLVNKLMSRSYFEYEQVAAPPKPKGFKVQMPTDEELSKTDETRIMDEIQQRMI